MSERPCRKCSTPVPTENAFCNSCGAPTSFRPPPGLTGAPASPPTERTPHEQARTVHSARSTTSATRRIGIGSNDQGTDGMGGVQLAHGEVVKRIYELGRIERSWGWVQGTLVVTDVRVLYRAEAQNSLNSSTLNKEIHLKDVKGVGLATRRGMSAAGLGAWLLGSFLSFWAVLFLANTVSAMMSFAGSGGSGGWLVFLLLIWGGICGTILVLRRRASVVVLSVFSSDIESSPISVTGVVGRSGGDGFMATLASPLTLILEGLGVIEAGAAAENADLASMQQVYAELGAVIMDLQSRATLGAD